MELSKISLYKYIGETGKSCYERGWQHLSAKSAFERQVGESVLIQQEVSRHRILNSKSEYNRCALPRLTTKLGAEEFEEWKKELKEEKLKEEDLDKKIRVLRKQRNKN